MAVAMEGFGQIEAGSQFSSLLSAAGVASYLALGMVLATGLIAVMIRLTLRGDRPAAVQAATGFFYLAVITGVRGGAGGEDPLPPTGLSGRCAPG